MPESRVPPVSTLRARRRAETMALIEAAAADLFEAQGYEQTTVEQIADRAGISMRTFYRHCASKDGTLVGSWPTVPPRSSATLPRICRGRCSRPWSTGSWSRSPESPRCAGD